MLQIGDETFVAGSGAERISLLFRRPNRDVLDKALRAHYAFFERLYRTGIEGTLFVSRPTAGANVVVCTA